MSLKETTTKVMGKVTGKLTDAQWQTRVDASQKKLDNFKADVVSTVQARVGSDNRKAVLDALGLELPPQPTEYRFTLPTTSDRTYVAAGRTEAEAANKVLALIGEDGAKVVDRLSGGVVKGGPDTDVTRDVSSLLAIVEAEKAKPADTATDAVSTPQVSLIERYAELEGEYEALRVAAREQAVWLNESWPGSYCRSGVNDVLRSLKLELLPTEQYFLVDAPLTGTVRYEVAAYSADEALAKTRKLNDQNKGSNGLRSGYVLKVADVGAGTIVR